MAFSRIVIFVEKFEENACEFSRRRNDELKSQYLEMQLSSGEDDVREAADIELFSSALLDTRKQIGRGMRNSRL